MGEIPPDWSLSEVVVHSFGANWCLNVCRLTDLDTIYSFQVPHFKSIPLSVDWLKRFGFEVEANRARNESQNISLTQTDKGMMEDWGWYLSLPEAVIPIHIRFVHQLQNIYFALTGQELTIDL